MAHKKPKNTLPKQSEIRAFIEMLNETYLKLHARYEKAFWNVYMNLSADIGKENIKMEKALKARDAFNSNEKHLITLQEFHQYAPAQLQERIDHWIHFFKLYQTPAHLKKLRDDIAVLEGKIHESIAQGKEGYIHPKTKKFKRTSRLAMRMMMSTNDDEKIRKACFNALEDIAGRNVDNLVELVTLRNEYAQGLGFEDFYAYKLMMEEGMKKKELFDIFDTIYDKTKYAFSVYDTLEKELGIKGLQKPWNTQYLLAGDFKKEEDPYFQFSDALDRWGRSFMNMGISFRGSRLVLDLLDRRGKYPNGFCHWPTPISYQKNKRMPGQANFTCNLVPNQPGGGARAMETLFHEGGHAAHYLNSQQADVCLNHEYPPASTAWAETQSMFLDTVFSSPEWRHRYAKNEQGEAYPEELYKRKVNKIGPLRPLSMMGISSVMYFEKALYEEKKLTRSKVLRFAKQNFDRHTKRSKSSISLLNVPHIYSWTSACSYHGYGLALLGLHQWREYFYKKYGYIVDNKSVGKEMKKVWSLASAKSFPELLHEATGQKLSEKAFVKDVTRSPKKMLNDAQKHIEALPKKKPAKDIVLDAHITMVDGKKKIADSTKGFENMTKKYRTWLEKR